jgi:hypothetical protein
LPGSLVAKVQRGEVRRGHPLDRVAAQVTRITRLLPLPALPRPLYSEQLMRQTMPGLKVCRTVIRDPDFAVGILPYQDLQRQIDRYTRRRQLTGVPAFGLPKIRSLWAVCMPAFWPRHCDRPPQTT